MQQENKRTKIINAAIQVFSKHGFYTSKVSQIAKAAGVADGTIYLYFKSKEDILVQVFMDSMDRANGKQRMALEGLTSATDRLRTFARVHFEMVGESPQLAEVLTVELRQSGKFMRQADMRPFGRYLSIISRIVSDGIESGEFIADISPRMCARMLFGAIDELALEWAVGNRTSGIEDAYIQTVTVFLNGLTVRK